MCNSELCNRQAEIETQMRGSQSFWPDVCMQMDFLGSIRAAQTFVGLELQNLEEIQGTELGGGCCEYRFAQLAELFEQLIRL